MSLLRACFEVNCSMEPFVLMLHFTCCNDSCLPCKEAFCSQVFSPGHKTSFGQLQILVWAIVGTSMPAVLGIDSLLFPTVSQCDVTEFDLFGDTDCFGCIGRKIIICLEVKSSDLPPRCGKLGTSINRYEKAI